MSKTYQLQKIWEAEFGVEWTKRNYMDKAQLREPFWGAFINNLSDVNSILEIGCNAGMNLQAIYKANDRLQITGLEPNNFAYKEALGIAGGKWRVIPGNIFDTTFDRTFDLVFTCTVLIHIHPDDILKALDRIYSLSGKYVLAMEYYWPRLKEIEYRGTTNTLWKRDFGALWLDNFNLNIVETGYVDARDGFDRVTWWLFQKK